ncbi:MAG: exosortase/archaeosortase family protein [Gemmatales bacterium]
MIVRGRELLIATVLSVSALVWAFWSTFADMQERWSSDPQYSHCYLVPLFSLWYLWSRREQMPRDNAWPHWGGLGIMLLGMVVRLGGSYLFQQTLEGVGFIICMLGLAWFLLGRSGAKWALPAIIFLVFLIPLPYRLQVMMGSPLQRIATVSSTYLLQTFGIPAVAEGNVILLENSHIGIVEACNGLGMLMTFFAVTTAVALLIRRPLVDRVIVVLSAVPIAIAVNILRITATGVLSVLTSPELARRVYHDLAGWFMMPIALLMVFGVIAFLNRFLQAHEGQEHDAPIPAGMLSGNAPMMGVPGQFP